VPVDSGVVLDLLLERKPFFAAAARLFEAFEAKRIEGFVSSLAFANIFYLLRKHVGGSEAIAILRKLRLLAGVVPANQKIVDQALSSKFGDFEDAIQYYAALENGLEAIVTRNPRDYETRMN
jgi:predicted nucleic acid-binding protein